MSLLILRPGTHYEVVATFYVENNTPWATPLGITILDDKHFRIRLFRGSKTFNYLTKGIDIAINIITDIEKFLITALKRYFPNWNKMLKFGKAKFVNAPILEDSNAIVEACCEHIIEKDEYAFAFYKIVNIEVRKVPIEPPCRAFNHMLDIVIYLTKIGHVSQNEVRKLLLDIEDSINIITRTCSSDYCKNILREIEHILRQVKPSYLDQDKSTS